MSTYGKFIEKTLQEEYTLENVIKKDSQSEIYLYKHNATDRRLIKIHSFNRNDHVFRKLQGTANENLPVIYDVCSCDGYLCILESYVQGTNLCSILSEGPLAPDTAIDYMLDICNGLRFLHQSQIIHRDIKPENVIIDSHNKAVLIDLQAARTINDYQHKDTTSLGTVGYAAPEQYGIHQSLPPTDIYALGVMFNEMLINAHPSVNTPTGKLGKIIKKCTVTQISKRYQTVDALIKDLKKYKRFH